MGECPGPYVLCLGIIVHLYLQSILKQDHDRDISARIDKVYDNVITYVESYMETVKQSSSPNDA